MYARIVLLKKEKHLSDDIPLPKSVDGVLTFNELKVYRILKLCYVRIILLYTTEMECVSMEAYQIGACTCSWPACSCNTGSGVV